MTRETTNAKLAGGKQVQVGNYKFTGKDLGKGSFAMVREAIHIHLRAHVSVKIIDLRKCNSYMLKHFLREAAILKDLDHPCIIW
jgi:serine/threonine protein kinase